MFSFDLQALRATLIQFFLYKVLCVQHFKKIS
jgi:hypothetical protein